MRYLGDIMPGQSLTFWWNTVSLSGASITRATNGTVSVYKGTNDTQTTTGVTDGEDNDSLTGAHRCTIATTDSFYEPGADYSVVVSGMVVDGQTINACIATFSIANRASSSVQAAGTLSGTHSSTTADLGTNAPSNDITGATVYFPSHKLSRVVDSYNTGTGVITFSPSVAVTLANGEPWILFPTPPTSTGVPPQVDLVDSPNATAIGNIQSGLASQSSVDSVEAIANQIETDTQDIQNRIPTALVGGRMDATVDGTGMEAGAVSAIQSGLATAAELAKVPKSDGTATWNATALASINAEVADVINTDTTTELSGVPAANAPLRSMIRWLFMKARNTITQTATTQTVMADDGTTPVASSTVSDNGTTATRGEFS